MYKIIDGNNVMIINVDKFVDVNYRLVNNFISIDKYLTKVNFPGGHFSMKSTW